MRALALMLLLTSSGCFPWFGDDDDDFARPRPDPAEQPPPTPSGDTQAPHISISVPSWPPLGPESSIEVSVTDDFMLRTLEIDFLHHTTESLSGSSDSVTVSGTTLGEGFGTLTLTAFDMEGWHQTRWVTDLLVDMSPPEITLGETTVAAAGELELWVADAWVLGAVELTIGETTLVHDFEDGFPSTIGSAWDYSLVTFPGTDLPLGTNQAALRLTDAAGNFVTETFTLTVDGQAPNMQIIAPLDGAMVSGAFDMIVEASDPEGGPVWIDISVSGTPAATAVGPIATVQLDAGELAPGAHVLEAVARDGAGNTSAPATVNIQVQ